MKRTALLSFTGILFWAASSPAAADTWCSGFANVIICDDFDRYCTTPPPYPEACPAEASRSDPKLRAVWRYTSWNYNTNSACGSNMCGEEITEILPSDPYGGRHANGGDEGGQLGQNTADLTNYIIAAMPGYTVANGSDTQPLVLTFTMGARDRGLARSNGYAELNLGDDTNGNVANIAQAPTDFVLVGGDNGAGCIGCLYSCTGGTTSTTAPWPTICQQESPHAACPPKQTFVRNSLAVGALAMLDTNPCHCCILEPPDPLHPNFRNCTVETRDTPEGWQVPTNWHLSYYDGLEWRVLKQGVGGPGSYGDFVYGNYITWGDNKNTEEGYETVVVTIKTSTVDIYHKTKMVNMVNGQWVESWVESKAFDLPRRYSGGFNRLRLGTKESCQLNSSSYTCWSGYANGKKRCKKMAEDRCDGGLENNWSKYVAFDNVKLSGGIGNVIIGACCRNDATCVETDLYTCETILGGRYQGDNSICAGMSCCPYPFADGDTDGDVDQDDFGAFQICYTGSGPVPTGCGCLDRNKDNRINTTDFAAFDACFTGANVTWSAALTPNCTP